MLDKSLPRSLFFSAAAELWADTRPMLIVPAVK
jgi:hypothetical protein